MSSYARARSRIRSRAPNDNRRHPRTPLRRSGLAYETAPAPAERASATDWRAVEHSPAFEALVKAKMRFIIPTTVFFLVYYFALPVLVGYAPDLMNTKVIGNINLAYL